MTDDEVKTRAAAIKRNNRRMDKRALQIFGVLIVCVSLYELYTLLP